MLLLHNLAAETIRIDVGPLEDNDEAPYDLLVDGPYERPDRKLRGLNLHGYGHR